MAHLCNGENDSCNRQQFGIGKATAMLWKTVLPIQQFATVTEIAEAASFLAHAEYATGSCLLIDGGNTAGGSL